MKGGSLSFRELYLRFVTTEFCAETQDTENKVKIIIAKTIKSLLINFILYLFNMYNELLYKNCFVFIITLIYINKFYSRNLCNYNNVRF